MKAKYFIYLFLALSIYVEVDADEEPIVKRGTYPFMGFIYFSDETVLDASGARFVRGAVLIRPAWLVTSAITYGQDRFPEKTLLARFGVVNIDSNFTLNEDEDEQEREVIQIIRPHNHSATQWWVTDISLMKTLLPFNNSSAVSPVALNPKREYNDRNCIALVFSRKNNNLNEKVLMKMFVEMMPPSIQNCGTHFYGNSMACAIDSDDNKNVMDPNFCQGNSGGPLICEGAVMGIQTYIDNDCKQPHLYQLLSAWEKIILCSTKDKCYDEICSNTCNVITKDAPENITVSSATLDSVEEDSSRLIETSSEEFVTPVTDINVEQSESFSTQEITSLSTHETTLTVEQEPMEIATTKQTEIKRTETTPSQNENTTDLVKNPEVVPEVNEDPSRKMNIQAQQQKKQAKRNFGYSNNPYFNFILLNYIFLTYVF